MPHPLRGRSALMGLLALPLIGGCGPTPSSASLGGEPLLLLSDEAVDFGRVPIATPRTSTVLLKNEGSGTLQISGVARSPSTGEAFSVDLDHARVPPGEAARLRLSFGPSQVGEQLGSVLVRSNDPLRPELVLPVRGHGVASCLEIEPETLSFGNVVIGTTKRRSLRLSNQCDRRLFVALLEGPNVRRCAAGVDDPSVFCVQGRDRAIGADGVVPMEPLEAVTLEVEFSAVIAGTRERGAFTLRSCDASACEIEVSLDGLGIEQGLRCAPPAVDFGRVNPGSCRTETVSCENIANAPVTVVGWGPLDQPPTSNDFSFAPSAVARLEARERVDVDVTYCPIDLGSDEGILQIETDRAQPNRFVQVNLTGSGGGPDVQLFPEQCDFGLVSLIAPARCTVLITNVGFEDLEISGIVPDTAGTGAFVAPEARADVVPPGGAYTITVDFLPAAVGPVESTLRVRTNDVDTPELEVRLVGEGVDLPSCQYELGPSPLDFGMLEVGRGQTRAFVVRNTGPHDCIITGVWLEPGSAPELSLPDGGLRSRIVPPGEDHLVRVDYAPSARGRHTGAVELSLSSARTPRVRVPIQGEGVSNALLFGPDRLDFGTLAVGCGSGARALWIHNPTSVVATIDSIAPAAPVNPAFTLGAPPSPLPGAPLTLRPEHSLELPVTFSASRVGHELGAIELRGTMDGQPYRAMIPISSRGATDGENRERFVQLGREKVDVLFVVDFSGSMGQEQDGLAAQTGALLRFARAHALDYQVGLVSDDAPDWTAPWLFHSSGPRGDAFGGPLDNRFATPNSAPDPETVLATNLRGTNLRGGVAVDETSFYASYLALSPDLRAGANAGILRRDAALSLVFFSDEPEQSSPATGAPSSDVQFYLRYWQALLGADHRHRLSVTAITGDVPGGCNGAGGSAVAGPRYLAAAEATGGAFASICSSDWAATAEAIAPTVFGLRSELFLSGAPAADSLELRLDGAPLPRTSASGTANWSYDAAKNAVRFSAFATPEPGAEVELRYDAQCR